MLLFLKKKIIFFGHANRKHNQASILRCVVSFGHDGMDPITEGQPFHPSLIEALLCRGLFASEGARKVHYFRNPLKNNSNLHPIILFMVPLSRHTFLPQPPGTKVHAAPRTSTHMQAAGDNLWSGKQRDGRNEFSPCGPEVAVTHPSYKFVSVAKTS